MKTLEESATLCLAFGNRKVGRVWTFSLPSFSTCPGASPWCRKHCYAQRLERFPSCRKAYVRNLSLSLEPDRFINEVLSALPEDANEVRIHVGGDFYSADYIDSWHHICKTRPKTLFWAYSRSWSVPSLLPSLNELRHLDNVEIFASVDETMPPPPEGWRVAFIENDERAFGPACPHQQGHVASCLKCGYCFRKKAGNVVFKIH